MNITCEFIDRDKDVSLLAFPEQPAARLADSHKYMEETSMVTR